jgi:hypothetical protein
MVWVVFVLRRACSRQVLLALMASAGLLSVHAGVARANTCTSEDTLTLVKVPKLSGKAAVGSTLTTSTGTWFTCTGNAITFSYRWSDDGQPIFGATGASYVVTQDDAGSDIKATVTASDNFSAKEADSDTLSIPGAPSAASDQTAPTSDETAADVPASAVPVDGGGAVVGAFQQAATTSSYTVDTWSREDVDNANGLDVVSSTAAGTYALTGVVLDQAATSPVSGATVSMSCGTCATVTTTTNSSGAFAFIDVPIGPSPQITVTASGYGLYSVANYDPAPDDQYETTVDLTSAAQAYDDSGSIGDATDSVAAGGSGYDSNYRVPPFVTVGIFPQTPTCANANPSSAPSVVRYSWRFYVLHTLQGEIGGDFGSAQDGFFHEQGAKAVAAAVQNYAWYWRQHRPSGRAYDLDNTTSYQCFLPHALVRRAFHGWLDDVLDDRIANSDGTIQQTFYKAGHYLCTDSSYPANGNDLSQLGAKARDEQCGETDWRNVDNYYYTGAVTAGRVPPRPSVSDTVLSKAVELDFPSLAGSSHVAWTYFVDKFVTDHWVTIAHERWTASARAIPTTFTYQTAAPYIYRARACNPVGCSLYVDFNDGFAIVPGA